MYMISLTEISTGKSVDTTVQKVCTDVQAEFSDIETNSMKI